ncbi:hypothetical protein [Alteromonas sp. RW2A1]|uniref:hypothetical protein n=1 Tax=Alteromonas sp. RW2A1 TaxID=1917158 RepID=UPI000A731FA9|nr:hypothetical protein [Alteromonas sp. RW2A1]
MSVISDKAAVAVKARYYKYESAKAVLDHVVASRDGLTRSANVQSLFSTNNIGVVTKGCKTPIDALEDACKRYKRVTGKKVRSDFNILFDHVVVLSEAHYARLEASWGEEKAKRQVLSHMIKYANAIKVEFGFEPISVQLHLDEGHRDSNGNFIRNVHGHVSMYNFDFKGKVAPLRHLMKKGKNQAGQTNSLNPHFVRFQDIAAEIFKPLKFKRGISKDITGRKHLEKEEFVREKLAKKEVELVSAHNEVNKLKKEIGKYQTKAINLNHEIQNLQDKHAWLSMKVDEIQGYFLSLEQAIRDNCMRAVMQIQNKTKALLSSMKPNL